MAVPVRPRYLDEQEDYTVYRNPIGPDVPPDVAQKLSDQAQAEQEEALAKVNRNPLEDLPAPQYREDPRREQIMQKMMEVMDRPQMPFLQMQAGRSGEMARYQALLNELDRSSERRYNSDLAGYQRQANVLSGNKRYVKISDNAMLDTFTGQTVMIDPSKTARGYSAQVRADSTLGAAGIGAQSRENVAGIGAESREKVANINKGSHLQGIAAQQAGATTRAAQKPGASTKPGTLSDVEKAKVKELDLRIKMGKEALLGASAKGDTDAYNEAAQYIFEAERDKNIILNGKSSAGPKPAAPVNATPVGDGDTGGNDPLGIR